jgi:nitrogenase-associated protein
MAEVVFYEKPGCAGNARQRRLLEQAGHTLVVRNLLAEHWTAARLRPYLAGRPVAAWFNASARRVRSGEIQPDLLDEKTALALLTADPILLRRPLIAANGRHGIGFDGEAVAALLGGRPGDELESCRRPSGASPCPAPSAARAKETTP